MKLQVKTRGQSGEYGKPRVFLTCHPQDLETVLPLIGDDLLRHANCAVWYDAEPEQPADTEELFACLQEMQLLVVAVSSVFLHRESRARDTELPFALAHHIPVLPIMLENGLAREFNKVTGTKLQVVSRYVSDPTATPYDEVLETYLTSVLIGDELAQRVRDAFDAYVFLSYRKKDRRHAQRLIHLIHENRYFRDIAIWYDEFLVPGEAYNTAIEDAFMKSGLFALAVTPSLLEDGNYVMTVEFPMARDRKRKAKDLQIVPVELYEPGPEERRTDRSRMKREYRGIPRIQDEHQKPKLNRAFLKALARISKKENDGSPTHRFFIGLAYLCGIDVEVNYPRALDLIRSAAEDTPPCFDATEKLVDMYLNGEGVARDAKTALLWQQKLVEQYRAEYAKGHSPDEHLGFGTRTFRALIRLSDMQRDLGNADEAMAAAEEALALSASLQEEVGRRETDRDAAVARNRLGSLCRAAGKPDAAMKHYARAAEVYRRLAEEIGTARARRDLSVSCERIGDLYRKQKDYDRALEQYEQALSLRAELAADTPAPGPRRDLSVLLTKLGSVRKACGDPNEAERYYREALELDRVLSREMKTPQALDDYAVSLVKMGDLCRAREQWADAEALLRQAVAALEQNARETGSLQYRGNLAGGLEKLAKALAGQEKRKEAQGCFARALALREQLALEAPSHTVLHELATTCCMAAEFSGDAEGLRRACRIWDDLCPAHPEYRRAAEHARRALERLTQPE